jgi:hypothetical protein
VNQESRNRNCQIIAVIHWWLKRCPSRVPRLTKKMYNFMWDIDDIMPVVTEFVDLRMAWLTHYRFDNEFQEQRYAALKEHLEQQGISTKEIANSISALENFPWNIRSKSGNEGIKVPILSITTIGISAR